MTSNTKQEMIRRKVRRKVKKAVAIAEKRVSTLYTRVKPLNKKFVERECKRVDVSESEFIDLILDAARGA